MILLGVKLKISPVLTKIRNEKAGWPEIMLGDCHMSNFVVQSIFFSFLHLGQLRQQTIQSEKKILCPGIRKNLDKISQNGDAGLKSVTHHGI